SSLLPRSLRRICLGEKHTLPLDRRPTPGRGASDAQRFCAYPPCFPESKGEQAMAESSLVLHCGARRVEEEELVQFPAPPPEGRWFPIAHHDVLRKVKETLTDAGYEVAKQSLGLSRNNHRFFGTLDLKAGLLHGVTLAVGVRNSTDKSFPLGFCA